MGSLAFWLAVDAPSTFGALRRTAAELQELARARLTRLLFHVARNNEFYGRRLQRAGIEWADPVLQRDPFRALGLLPLVSNLDFRLAGNRAFDRGAVSPSWYVSSSSDPAGEPLRVYYEPRAWARLKYLVGLRARSACGFRAPKNGSYGTPETMEIAWQCSAGNKHLNADVFHLEAVDVGGRGLPPGEEGDLVATSLLNRAMPLIRYRTGDRGALLSGSCSCGCVMPLVAVVARRTAETPVSGNGQRICTEPLVGLQQSFAGKQAGVEEGSSQRVYSSE